MSVAKSFLSRKETEQKAKDFNPTPLNVASIEFLHVGSIHFHGSFEDDHTIALCNKFLSLNVGSESEEIYTFAPSENGVNTLGCYPAIMPENIKPSIKESRELQNYTIICFINGTTMEGTPFWGYYSIDGRFLPKFEKLLKGNEPFDLHRIGIPFYESTTMPGASRIMFSNILMFSEKKTNLVVFPKD